MSMKPEGPLKGPALHAALLEKFKAVRAANGKLDCEKLADAALQIGPVYELVFGSNFVSNHLQQDIANNSGRMRAGADALRKTRNGGQVYADELIAWELEVMGIPAMRKAQNSGVKGMLWMKRALDFVFTLLYNMFGGAMDSATSKECAQLAYDRILKPYHGFLVSNIVSLAFSLAPSKTELIQRLGFEMSEAKGRVQSIEDVVRPIIDQLTQLLDQSGCNFPDKA